MAVYGVMCPVCGTMIFKETPEELTAVECELCKKAFEPQEIIFGLKMELLKNDSTKRMQPA